MKSTRQRAKNSEIETTIDNEATRRGDKSNQRKYLLRLCSFPTFVSDHALQILGFAVAMIILILFLAALKIDLEASILIIIIMSVTGAVTFLVEYGRRRRFYYHLLDNLSQMDQAYLVLETIGRPNFFDGRILQEVLTRVDKSAAENIQQYASKTQDFREYIELWIHETKAPLATLSLITKDPRAVEQLKRLDNYIEQVLYFVRAKNAERDYIIKQVQLAQVVQVVAVRNREILQAKQIDFQVGQLDQKVYTDVKWLEFILNQIITNSIKYHSAQIIVRAKQVGDAVELSISDNGIGIAAEDLPRVFEKSFTGKNGRQTEAGRSTGMGLYLAHSLCEKLGHQIAIQSQVDTGTTVTITFANHKFFDVIGME